MLSKEQIDRLADTVNEKVNLPFITESLEKTIFVQAIEVIDAKLEEVVPPDVLAFLNDLDDGLDEAEVKKWAEKESNMINERLNIPILDASQETQLLVTILEYILEGLKKNATLDKLIA